MDEDTLKQVFATIFTRLSEIEAIVSEINPDSIKLVKNLDLLSASLKNAHQLIDALNDDVSEKSEKILKLEEEVGRLKDEAVILRKQASIFGGK